jgi:hypothetical protein
MENGTNHPRELSYNLPPDAAGKDVYTFVDKATNVLKVYIDTYNGRYGYGLFHGSIAGKHVAFLCAEILYFKRVKEGTWVYTVRDAFLVEQSIENILKQLGEVSFIRIGRSVVVNFHRVNEHYHRHLKIAWEHGEKVLNIGPNYRNECSERFQHTRTGPRKAP